MNNEDEDRNSHCSKTKLKGSDLIFQRIKWDESINKEHVVVVYLDRFLGLQEIRFNDFKGVHEDYKEGIPFHRIRAYKLRGKVVWDRELRIDRLTGVSQHFADDDQDESSSHYIDNSVASEQTTRLGRCPDAQQIASVLRFDHTTNGAQLTQALALLAACHCRRLSTRSSSSRTTFCRASTSRSVSTRCWPASRFFH